MRLNYSCSLWQPVLGDSLSQTKAVKATETGFTSVWLMEKGHQLCAAEFLLLVQL